MIPLFVDGVAVYGAVVATLAFIVGGVGLTWNIVSAIQERHARRAADVHCALVFDEGAGTSKLEFLKAGPGPARHLEYLLVEDGDVYQGTPAAYLLADDRVTSPTFPMIPKQPRTTLVWAYMDIDHNVQARSNDGEKHVFDHPTAVEIGDIFKRFYPNVELPVRQQPLPRLGEL